MQRLAAGLAARTHGLDAGKSHIGVLCDAITAAGIDASQWTVTALQAALDADMRATGMSWPDRIERPAAFLAARLRRLPAKPPNTIHRQPSTAATAAQIGNDRPETSAARKAADELARWHADVTAATTAEERARVLQADEAKFHRRSQDPVAALAAAGRRAARMFPGIELHSALQQWVTEILGDSECAVAEPVPVARDLSTDLLMDLAISGGCECVVCGAHRATMRAQLPLKSMVCDQCWPMIAAELSGDTDERLSA